MIHKHDLRTAISDLGQALEHVEHYSGRPEVFCLKQLLVNPLSYAQNNGSRRLHRTTAKVRNVNTIFKSLFVFAVVKNCDATAHVSRDVGCNGLLKFIIGGANGNSIFQM